MPPSGSQQKEEEMRTLFVTIENTYRFEKLYGFMLLQCCTCTTGTSIQASVSKLEQSTNENGEKCSLHRRLRGVENMAAIIVLMLARGVLQARAK